MKIKKYLMPTGQENTNNGLALVSGLAVALWGEDLVSIALLLQPVHCQ